MAEAIIEHEGIVERVEAGSVHVKITSRSACGSCAARQACGLAEAQEKIVVVPTSDAANYVPGDVVRVGVRRRAGLKAVAMAYVGALAVLLGTLVVGLEGLGWGEGRSALAALAAVTVYYVVLWLLRRKIEQTIHFTITKN